MPKMSNNPSQSAIDFVRAVGCKSHVEVVAQAVADFGGETPTEDEVLARCRLVFEYMVHETMRHSSADDWDVEVEIQAEEK